MTWASFSRSFRRSDLSLASASRAAMKASGEMDSEVERKSVPHKKLNNSHGAGIAHWFERWTRDRKVAGSNPCWSGGRIYFSRVDFLCWLLFRYPFHHRVTAVARKRPWSFCQKCRWQVTAKHAYTLRMWLCMKWHGAWSYGVHRTRRDGSSFFVASPMPAL